MGVCDAVGKYGLIPLPQHGSCVERGQVEVARAKTVAKSAGIEMGPGDIAFKCNFATLDPTTGVVTSRRCDRDFTREGPVLCAALGECLAGLGESK